MSETVEKGTEDAGTQTEVEKKGADASTAKELSAEDIAELAEALKLSLAREAKTAEERDNYKEGMLKAKGKLKSDEGGEDEGADADKTKKSENSSDLVDIVKELLKRNQEIVTAVVNKSQVATTGQGTGSESKVEVSDNLLSADQLKDLKTRGWDDTKIALFKKNLKNTRA